MERDYKTLEEMDIYELSRLNVSYMTTRQLKQFIKVSAKIVDEAFETDNEQLRKSLKIIGAKTGTRSVKGEKHIVRGIYKLDRKELIERAHLLQSHLSIDIFTNRAERDYKELNRSTMEKISKTLGLVLADFEFPILWNLIHEIRNLYKAFDSTDVATLYEDARSSGKKGSDVLLAVMEFMENNKDADKKYAMDMISSALRDEL